MKRVCLLVLVMAIVAVTLATAVTAWAAPKGIIGGQTNKYACQGPLVSDLDVPSGKAYQGLKDGTYDNCTKQIRLDSPHSKE